MYRIILPVLICFCNFSVQSQNLMHSYGAVISDVSKKKDPAGGAAPSLLQTSLCYFPRYNFIENENSSLSVGMPVSIGIGLASSTMGDDVGISFAYDIPVVLDYNLGCKSTPDNESTFGGFFGLGFGYNHFAVSQSQYSNLKGNSYGPIFRTGVRFGSNKDSWKGQGITISFFYKPGLETGKWRTFGSHVLLDL
jgi:hypothetical protein